MEILNYLTLLKERVFLGSASSKEELDLLIDLYQGYIEEEFQVEKEVSDNRYLIYAVLYHNVNGEIGEEVMRFQERLSKFCEQLRELFKLKGLIKLVLELDRIKREER